MLEATKLLSDQTRPYTLTLTLRRLHLFYGVKCARINKISYYDSPVEKFFDKNTRHLHFVKLQKLPQIYKIKTDHICITFSQSIYRIRAYRKIDRKKRTEKNSWKSNIISYHELLFAKARAGLGSV